MVYKSCGTTTIEKWEKAEKREVAIVQYMKVTVPIEALEKNLGCICARWSTSDEVDNRIYGEEL